jgi:hypothetical protein
MIAAEIERGGKFGNEREVVGAGVAGRTQDGA